MQSMRTMAVLLVMSMLPLCGMNEEENRDEQTEIVRKSLRSSITNVPDYFRKELVETACQALDDGADPNEQDGIPFLCMATQDAACLPLVKKLLDKKAMVNQGYGYRGTPLCVAVTEARSLAMVQCLARHGARLEKGVPLVSAALLPNNGIFNYLLGCGVKMDARMYDRTGTALIEVAALGRSLHVIYLLLLGADATQTYDYGLTRGGTSWLTKLTAFEAARQVRRSMRNSVPIQDVENLFGLSKRELAARLVPQQKRELANIYLRRARNQKRELMLDDELFVRMIGNPKRLNPTYSCLYGTLALTDIPTNLILDYCEDVAVDLKPLLSTTD